MSQPRGPSAKMTSQLFLVGKLGGRKKHQQQQQQQQLITNWNYDGLWLLEFLHQIVSLVMIWMINLKLNISKPTCIGKQWMNVGFCICLLLLNGWVWYCPVEMLWNDPCSRPRIDNCKRTLIESHFSKSRVGDYFLECNLFKDSTAILLSSFYGSLQNGWLLGASQQRHPSVSTWLRIPKKVPTSHPKSPSVREFFGEFTANLSPIGPWISGELLGNFRHSAEQWKKGPWLVRLYRGWHPTQLYRDYNKPL